MKLVFMGTPDFAETALAALLDSRHTVAAVYTQPDKPVGRKAVLTPPPVKALAVARGVPVYQPTKLRDGTVAAQIAEIAPDAVVVVAYGRLLPPEVLSVPRLGCINVHASLLPKYRGAGPIEASVLHGEAETGVTTMYMAEGLDTGDMILQAKTPIDPDEQAPELRKRLATLGAELLLETLERLENGTAPRIPQPDAGVCWAPMLKKEDARMDFTRPASELHDLVRGMAGWPVAHCVCGGKVLKVHRSAIVSPVAGNNAPGEGRFAPGEGRFAPGEGRFAPGEGRFAPGEGRFAPGTVIGGKRFVVACGDGALELLEVQTEGAKRVSGADFLRGHATDHLE